jgi:hypothetical protein
LSSSRAKNFSKRNKLQKTFCPSCRAEAKRQK